MIHQLPVDLAAVTAYYDEHGYCHTIEVRLNAPGLAREDVTEAVRAVFTPGAPTPARGTPGYRHTELGGTAIIPNVRVMNGGAPPSNNGNRPKG